MKRFFILLSISFCLCKIIPAQIRMGAEQIKTYLPLLQNKQIGLVINQTSRVGNTHLVDTLLSLGVQLTALFTPEHGIRGNADAGENIKDGLDTQTGLPIFSLYGNQKKPTPKQLENTDIIIFDIQDVGARFYTYISTLYYIMQACAEQNKELIVTDRPNPCDYIAGPILNPKFRSFVGMFPLPILHGCTIGELAQMINGEGWLETTNKCKLTVIPITGWKHGQPYQLPIKPSPNLPDKLAIACYTSLCPFEGTSVSVGRGTYQPHHLAGSPFFKRYLSKLLTYFPGTDTTSFVPKSLVGWAKHPVQEGKKCYGIRFYKGINGGFTLKYVVGFYQLYKKAGLEDKFFTNPKWFDLLMGTDQIRKAIIAGKDYQEIECSWKEELSNYILLRDKYLIYPK